MLKPTRQYSALYQGHTCEISSQIMCKNYQKLLVLLKSLFAKFVCMCMKYIGASTGLCSNIMWDRGATGVACMPRQAKTTITWQHVGLIPSGTPANDQRHSIPYVPNSVFGLCVFEVNKCMTATGLPCF